MRLPDNRIKSIYCHSDGYLEGVGDTLREHYTDVKKIKALLALGDISSLYPLVAPPVGVEHGFDFGKRANGVTEAYKRFLEGRFREHFKLTGTPLRIEMKSSSNPFIGE